MGDQILWFKECSYQKKNLVGGKNASLGELYRLSQILCFNVVNGFAITTSFYEEFIEHNKLSSPIEKLLQQVNVHNLEELQKWSNEIKTLITSGVFTEKQKMVISSFYSDLSELYNTTELSVAVRSSAIAEDLPTNSFAGQQDTYLNVIGIDSLYKAVKQCFASLFNARALSYRHSNNIEASQVKISVGVQKMVRSDLASSGVAFSLDTESGFKDIVLINGSYGLGESVVQGTVSPDEFLIFKPTLKDGFSSIIEKKMGKKDTKIICEFNKPQLAITPGQSIVFYNDNHRLLGGGIIEYE